MADKPKNYPSVDRFLVCEDIRIELYRKSTFVGVYTGDTIVVGSLPHQLPKLAIYQRLRGCRDGEFDMQFKIIDPLGKEIVTLSGKLNVEKEKKNQLVDFNVILGNIKLEAEGAYTVETYMDEKQKIGSFTFRVEKGEPKRV